MIKSKKQMFLTIIIFTLVMMLGTISYAFFNYTRTGTNNNVRVGRVNFLSSENNTINLTDVFPTDSSHLDSTNSSTVTVNITGDTNYDKGIEYKVSIVDVQNIINNKEVPISFSVTASNLGTKSSDYYNERGSTTNVYNLREEGSVEEGQDILIGYIKPDNQGVNGSINVTAFIDKDEVGISDTVSRIVNDNLVYGETDAAWIAGRTILTTEEWNGLATNGISFKIKVEANEGIWVNEPSQLVLKNLNSIQEWKDVRANVTSIEFHKDGIVPSNPVTTIDVTDLTSNGSVNLYLVDDGLGNNTYKAIVVADDEIYAPASIAGAFQQAPKLTTFNGENLKVDNVTNMAALFYSSSSLQNLVGMDNWNVSNVRRLSNLFANCSSITNVDQLKNWDVSGATNILGMFINCTSLQNVNGLFNWNISNATSLSSMFSGCENLMNINGLVNWNTSNIQDMSALCTNCQKLQNVDALFNWDTSNVTVMNMAFGNCYKLQNINGLAKWDTSKVTNMSQMFNDCKELQNVDGLTNWDMSRVANNIAMFQNVPFTSITMPSNYTRIDKFMFNHNSEYTGSTFIIPKTVTYIGSSHIFYDFGLDDIFNKFIVENGSTSFKTINDILYTYDGTKLISIPRAKTFTNNTYEIPEGVTFLNELSFSRNLNIDTLVLPNSYVIEKNIVENNNSYGFSNSGNSLTVAIYLFTSISEYEVKNDNTRYISDSGCIYSKDGTELIAVPLHYNGILNIKSGTTTIGQNAFYIIEDNRRLDNLTQINIPASVTTIDADQLTFLNKIARRSTNPITITIDSGNPAYQVTNNQILHK